MLRFNGIYFLHANRRSLWVVLDCHTYRRIFGPNIDNDLKIILSTAIFGVSYPNGSISDFMCLNITEIKK